MANQTNSAIINYGLALTSAAVMGSISCYGFGDAAGLVALKAILAPFFLLANRAVPTYFREPLIEPRWTGRAIEAHFLNALVFACFMTFMLWRPDRAALGIIFDFVWMTALMSVFQMGILSRQIKRLRNSAG